MKDEDVSCLSLGLWLNPDINPNSPLDELSGITYADVERAAERLQRFAPLLLQLFPELADSQGLIESDLLLVQAPPLVPIRSNGYSRVYRLTY